MTQALGESNGHGTAGSVAFGFALVSPAMLFPASAKAADIAPVITASSLDGFRLTASGYDYVPPKAMTPRLSSPLPAPAPSTALPATASGSGHAHVAASADPPPATPGITPHSEHPRQRDGLTLAAGVITAPSYVGSNRNNFSPAGGIKGRYKGFSFSSRGTSLSVDLIRERRGDDWDVRFGPVVNLRSDRSSRIHDPQVAALGKRGRALELGLYAGLSKQGVITSKHDQLGVRVAVVRDVTGKHGSTLVLPSIEYGTPLSRTSYVGVSASTSIVGKKFGRYYFDVTPAGSAASGLPAYAAASTKSGIARYSIGMAGMQSLSGDLRKGWAIVGGAQYSRLQGRYARSPIVAVAGSRGQWMGGVGLSYSF